MNQSQTQLDNGLKPEVLTAKKVPLGLKWSLYKYSLDYEQQSYGYNERYNIERLSEVRYITKSDFKRRNVLGTLFWGNWKECSQSQ